MSANVRLRLVTDADNKAAQALYAGTGGKSEPSVTYSFGLDAAW